MKNRLFFSILLLSVFATNVKASQANNIRQRVSHQAGDMVEVIALTDKSVIASDDLKHVRVCFYQNKFLIIENGKITVVQDHHVDSSLRNISSENLKRFFCNMDGFVRLQKDSNNDYRLESFLRLRGGGIGGASFGFWAGKIAVYAVAYGAIGAVSLLTGPAAGYTASVLSGVLSVPIEAASNVGAIAGGIAGGVATGPV